MPTEPTLRDELKRAQREPLLPAEKRLIIWSLVIGVALLGLLVWLSGRFFPAGATPG